MSRPRLLAALAALTLPLALAPAAHADAFDRIFKDYQSTGTIDACKYSEAELKQAKGEVPNDIEAYAPDFPNALEGALEQRAGGACDTAQQPATTTPATTTPGTVTPTTTTPTGPTTPAAGAPTTTPAPPSDPTASAAIADDAIAKTALAADTSDAGTPAPVIALGVLGALLALGGLIYGLVHWLGFDPRWTHRLRHAVAEAGWRTGNTWSEFADWVRMGR